MVRIVIYDVMTNGGVVRCYKIEGLAKEYCYGWGDMNQAYATNILGEININANPNEVADILRHLAEILSQR